MLTHEKDTIDPKLILTWRTIASIGERIPFPSGIGHQYPRGWLSTPVQMKQLNSVGYLEKEVKLEGCLREVGARTYGLMWLKYRLYMNEIFKD